MIRSTSAFERIRELGWEPIATYADRGITGEFAIMRPGLQRLLRDARDGRFEVLFAEALDRISRSQADTAAIFRRLEFRGVGIHTLSEGRVGAMEIGFRGVMNELFLTDLRHKVRRGMEGALRRGRIGGRVPYGYRSDNRIGPDGRPELGLRRIEPAEAEVVRRIFRAYADGVGLERICGELNEGAVAAPAKCPAVAAGAPQAAPGSRATGILFNELYRGLITLRQELVAARSGHRADADDDPRARRVSRAGDARTADRRRCALGAGRGPGRAGSAAAERGRAAGGAWACP